MLYRYYLLLLLLVAAYVPIGAQDFPPEDICVPIGDGFIANVINDNVPPGGGQYGTTTYQGLCFVVDNQGNVFFSQEATPDRCCGPQEPIIVQVIRFGPDGEQDTIAEQVINIEVKCLKPDCGLVDLEEYPQPFTDPTNENPEPVDCIPACENSEATYLYNSTSGFTYDWMAVNGAVSFDPSLPGQVTIQWGPVGGSSISVDIYDANGNLVETRVWCVELAPAPVADFTFSPVACLNQEVYFTNTSTGAPATFDWKFGDGTTAQNVTNPSHAYSAPGTYTVTLYATSTNVNADGSDGCCCVDSISYEIDVDPLPAPGIFWISTLCENDQSDYWTDATGCDSLIWTVSGNGMIVAGQNTDTITVDWGAGPSGTVTLRVVGCDDDYCPQPSTAVVPIISSTGVISGPVAVCKGQTASYELPKWMTVTYNWSTSDPTAVINGSNQGHIVSVTWPTTPGTYQLTVDYGSDFLAGLPGHSGSDCYGSAVIDVVVLGDFYITATPNPVCLGDASFMQGFSDIGPTSYNWTVAGYPLLDATGPTANILWPSAGIYTVTAEVVNPADYCVDIRSTTVVVKDAVDPAITGPSDYCPGEPVIYSIPSPTPGYSYNWTPTGGSVITGNGGPSVEVIFTATSGAMLSVTGTDGSAPFCESDPAVVNPTTRDFMGTPAIFGPSPCTNSQAVYGITVPQHPDATYSWSVSPAIAGSVVDNIDTASPTINWNNTPTGGTIQVVIELCGQTLTLAESFTLNAPIAPVIVQSNGLCPSGSAVLSVNGASFTSVNWNTGATTPSITITSPGNYFVNTVDVNGCPGVDQITVEYVDGPAVTLSMSGNNAICVNDPPYPANPVFTASTDAANTIEWFCNGTSQGAAATGNNSLIHIWNDTIKTYAYTVLVTDPNGCTEMPDPLLVYQQPCCDTPYVTQPLAQNHTFTAINRSPDCAVVDLVANWSADSVDCHAWDLPRYTSILGGGGDTIGNIANDSLTIRLPGVGCYKVESEIYRWAYDYDTTTVTDPFTGVMTEVVTKEDSIKCGDFLLITVCNPLEAEFDFSENCGTVSWINDSQTDPALTSGTVNYVWDYGDGIGGSTLENPPPYSYGANGSYTVTLTISDGACESTFTDVVTVENLPDSDFTLSPNPACYGQPVTFTGTGTSVLSWTWNFGDGAEFVGNNPQHTFLPAGGSGTSVVTLTTVNSGGCTDVVTQTIVINPNPDTVAISASNGLIICEGTSTTLSVPTMPGNTYLWTTGATTSSIVVNAAGTYGLTIISADSCATIIDPVEVQLIPLPDASWFGNPFICDQGFTTLTASAGGGHTYEWKNLTTGATWPNRSYPISFFPSVTQQDIVLTVTNDFGCEAQASITVFQVDSPAPLLAITGGTCEGDGSTITVTNPEPDVVYTWSTGATGTSIFTYQAGGYTVLATNVISGCTGTAVAIINPLPDLCLVPSGCYETCDPDTLYAPLGNYSYVWYDENGMVIDTDDSTVVSTSGQYYVVVTDLATGCVATSNPLILEVINCDSTDCDDLVTRFNPTNADEVDGACCYDLTYTNLPAGVYFIRASSTDAELTASNVNPVLGYVGTPDAYTIEFAIDATLTTELPAAMTGPAVASICPEAILNNPQLILIEYLDAQGNIVCEATLETFCEPTPDCVYIESDTLICNDDGTLTLTLTVCSPSDLGFDVTHLELMASSLAATIDLPDGITVSPALTPGTCRTFNVTLSALTPGDDFCYTLVGHSADPDIDPTALCCSDQDVSCLEIPDCDPCDKLIVEGVVPVDGEEGCCYDIYLFDGEASYDFDQIDLCLLGGTGTLSVNGSLGDPLIGVVNATGTTASIFSPTGGLLPDQEVFRLPKLCIEGATATNHQLEIKWMNEQMVICRDTVDLFCPTDCGYLVETAIECGDGAYYWQGSVVNNSDFPMGEAHIQFPIASGLSAYDTTIVFPSPINPGDAAPITIIIGGPAGPGDTLCFTVSLHEVNDDNGHLNCCNFKATIVLPDCVIDKCACEDLLNLVQQGFDTLHVGPGPRDYLLRPLAQFSSCDVLSWRVRTLAPNTSWINLGEGYTMPLTMDNNLLYLVNLIVSRTDTDGNSCPNRNISMRYDFRNESLVASTVSLEIFPNPAADEVRLVNTGGSVPSIRGILHLVDINGKIVRVYPGNETVNNTRFLDLRGLASGVYLLRGEGEDSTWVKRIVKQ